MLEVAPAHLCLGETPIAAAHLQGGSEAALTKYAFYTM